MVDVCQGLGTIKIERATLEDAAAILALQKHAYQSEAEIYNDFSIQPLLQTLEELVAEFQSHDIFKVAPEKDNLVGSVRSRIMGATCCIGKLIVHPAHQNRGIGQALMAYVERHNCTAERFELFTGSRSARNLYLYEKIGYREYKREKVNERLTIIFLEKRQTH